jgi:hypothetical protein
MRDQQRVSRGLRVRDEDVQLRLLTSAYTGGRCEVDAGIADRGRNPR